MKEKNKNIKVTYTYVKSDTSDLELEHAFDVLFEEVLRRDKLKKK
jgi:hypothetical protein